ncbi:cytochrome c [Sulfurimonas sp.]|uniref:c-type cytochrome n=1 Tax=Sulfurimonas sp. TaxID=2022749 RepID=UPI0035642B1D
MKVLFSIILTFTFFGCQSSNSTSESKYGKNTPKDNIKAKQLFQKCQRCHGERGELHAIRKSDIIAFYKKEEIVEALKDYQKGKRNKHRFGHLMKGIVSDFSDHEIHILAEYISQFKKSKK